MTKRVVLILTLSLLGLAANISLAQTGGKERVRIVKSNQENKCLANLYLVQFMTDFVDVEKQRLFVIARRSRGENQQMDWQRLSAIRKVLALQGFPFELVTLASGQVSDEKEGFLEFWIGSELRGITYLKQKERVCIADG